MNNIEYANEALQHARKVTPLKSSNKQRSGKVGEEERLKKAQAAEELVHGKYPGLVMPEDWAKLAETEGFGNCTHLSGIAKRFLDAKRVTSTQVQLGNPGDHVFLVVGRKDAVGDLPRRFEEWDKEFAICDPWANIVCSSPEYPQQWRLKMKKWSSRGKKVRYGDRWILPDSDEWMGSLEKCEKLVMCWDF